MLYANDNPCMCRECQSFADFDEEENNAERQPEQTFEMDTPLGEQLDGGGELDI